METNTLTPLLTTEQVAEHLACPARTVEDWRYRGVGPRYIRLRGKVRYRMSDVAAWLETALVETHP